MQRNLPTTPAIHLLFMTLWKILVSFAGHHTPYSLTGTKKKLSLKLDVRMLSFEKQMDRNSKLGSIPVRVSVSLSINMSHNLIKSQITNSYSEGMEKQVWRIFDMMLTTTVNRIWRCFPVLCFFKVYLFTFKTLGIYIQHMFEDQKCISNSQNKFTYG